MYIFINTQRYTHIYISLGFTLHYVGSNPVTSWNSSRLIIIPLYPTSVTSLCFTNHECVGFYFSPEQSLLCCPTRKR